MLKLLAPTLSLMLLAAPAGAVQIVPPSNLGGIGVAFERLSFLIHDANGLTLGGAKTFDLQIGSKLATGHLSETFAAGEDLFVQSPGAPVILLPQASGASMDFEFTFEPITILTQSPFDLAGTLVSKPFTMTGLFNWPSVETIDYVGQGTVTAGFLPRDNSAFSGAETVGFAFSAPEPSASTLLALGVGAILAARWAGKRRRYESC